MAVYINNDGDGVVNFGEQDVKVHFFNNAGLQVLQLFSKPGGANVLIAFRNPTQIDDLMAVLHTMLKDMETKGYYVRPKEAAAKS